MASLSRPDRVFVKVDNARRVVGVFSDPQPGGFAIEPPSEVTASHQLLHGTVDENGTWTRETPEGRAARQRAERVAEVGEARQVALDTIHGQDATPETLLAVVQALQILARKDNPL